MLFKLVDQTCAEINRLDAGNAIPILHHQLLEVAGDTLERFAAENTSRDRAASLAAAGFVMASVVFTCVKAIPQLAAKLAKGVNDRRLPAPARASIACLLAYLVQPHDLIPDSAMGGYGFLDDAIYLRAGLVQYLDLLPDGAQSAETESQTVGLLISLCPPVVRPQMQHAVSSLSNVVQLLSFTGPEIAEFTLAQILANPLQMSAPAAPQGFSPQPARNFEQGFWGKGGAYIEGENIIMPGGAGIINGELFIPGM